MEYLSKHLTREAAEKTRSGLPNRIPDKLLPNIVWMGENIIDPLMEYFKFPNLDWIYIMYRSPAVNKLAGSSPSSWHPLAAAGDIKTIGLMKVPTQSQIFYFIANNLRYDRLLWEKGNKHEPQWIHVQGRPGHLRQQIGLHWMERTPQYQYFKSIEDFNQFKNKIYK